MSTSDQKLVHYFIFYVAILLFFGVGAITTTGLSWYATLTPSVWILPQLLIACIWGVLFILVSLSMCVFWDASVRDQRFYASVALYLGNAALVLFWNYLFFGLHLLLAASVVAVVVTLSLMALMVSVRKVSNVSMMLLVPYLLWLIYATYISYLVTVLNT